MAKQDISSKVLLTHNDVFSDVINGLLFGRQYIDENKLRDMIPESSYEDFDGGIRSMQRDLLKEYGDGNNYFAIAIFGIDSQTKIDPTIPIRVMGYDYTVYKRQLDKYNDKKRCLRKLIKNAKAIGNAELVNKYQKEFDELGNFKLTPVVTVVLNFSSVRWNEAKTLKELVPDGYPEILEHMPDYKVNVFDVRYLDEEIKDRLKSDFKDVITVLTDGYINKSRSYRRLKYPVDTLNMLYAYTNDEHYLKIRNKIVAKEYESEVVNMHSFWDDVERDKTIDTAKNFFKETNDMKMTTQVIKCGLNVSMEEAQKVFDTEVLNTAMV